MEHKAGLVQYYRESGESLLPLFSFFCFYICQQAENPHWLGVIPLNSDNKPWAYICSKGFFAGLIIIFFLGGGGAHFQRGLLLEGILRFKMGWA